MMMNRILLMLMLAGMMNGAAAQTADSLAAHRLGYKTALHEEIKVDTSLVAFYPFRSQFRVKAIVELLSDQPVFQMTTSSGMKKAAQKMAKLVFRFKGRSYTLYGYQLSAVKAKEGYATHFFVPFKDATTGKATYGAGRYLDFKLEDIRDGQLLIDFNLAYNPYCAFTDGYNCPIPPAENHISLAVKTG